MSNKIVPVIGHPEKARVEPNTITKKLRLKSNENVK